MEESRAKPVCAEEALALLNCVTQSPYEEDKFLRLLHSLRHCVLVKHSNGWTSVCSRTLIVMGEDKNNPVRLKH
ncbi:hypothetical protein GmHk_05G014393 [Glycine max]|nr:hypothetical protein GmHk_05G014393 [Glycine max]